MDQRSPVHELVNALWRALPALDSTAQTGEIEQWCFSCCTHYPHTPVSPPPE